MCSIGLVVVGLVEWLTLAVSFLGLVAMVVVIDFGSGFCGLVVVVVVVGCEFCGLVARVVMVIDFGCGFCRFGGCSGGVVDFGCGFCGLVAGVVNGG